MIFPGFSMLWRGLASVVLAVLAGSCTVVVDEGSGHYRPSPRPQLCTAEYVPVCAVRGHDRKTFANACTARRAGYGVVHRGQCQRESRPSRPAMCTRDYRPVCARRGGKVRTFSNACEARAADFRIISGGSC
jgi:hypothetical protein